MAKTEQLVEIKRGKTGSGLLIENDGYISKDVSLHNKRICESFENNEWHVPKPFIVDAVLQKYDTKNANGRVYPEAILRREVAKYQEIIKDNRALGECNHPDSSNIDLSRTSHKIIECHWEGKTLVGQLELLVSEAFRRNGTVCTCGDQVALLLLSDFKIGISSRAVGSVEERLGQMIVGEDLELLAWDIVATPSTPGSYIGRSEDLAQYVESNTQSQYKPKLNESSKVDKILNILSE